MTYSSASVSLLLATALVNNNNNTNNNFIEVSYVFSTGVLIGDTVNK